MKIFLTILLAVGSALGVCAQNIEVKTNLLYDLTTTINLGVEFRTGERTSIDVPMSYNPWDFGGENNRQWKHYLVQPGFRYWLGGEAFSGHFVGVHGHYAFYSLGALPLSDYMKAHHFEGTAYGAGVSWGYRWNFRGHLALETELGLGYAMLDYKIYDCGDCGDYISKKTQDWFGPTKAAVNLIYSIGEVREVPVRERAVRERVEREARVRVPEERPARVKAVRERDNRVMVADARPVREPRVRGGRATEQELVVDDKIVRVKRGGKPVREREVLVAREKPVRVKRARRGRAVEQQATPVQDARFIPSFVVPEPELHKDRTEELRADLEFVFAVAELDPTYRNNMQELRRLRMAMSAIRSARRTAVTGVNVVGYASPEGTTEFNQRLSERRAAAVRDYLLASTDLPDALFRVRGEGERPDGLRAMVKVDYVVEPFTLEEAQREILTRPQALSLDEMFQVACLYDPESERYREIFEIAALTFPNDDVANINAAAVALMHGDANAAAGFLERVRNQTPVWWDNVGIVFYLRGDVDRAAAAFTNAGTTGLDNAATLQRLKKE